MLEKIFVTALLSVLFTCSVYADALPDLNKNSVMYFYAENCGYCKKFNPIYKKLERNGKNKCNFIKLDVMSQEGAELANSLNIWTVPFVIITNAKENVAVAVKPDCMLDYSCINKIFTTVIK